MHLIHVWWDGAGDGPTNMAADELLAAESLRLDALLVRIYGWEPTTISLGAFQKLDDATAVAEIRGVPLVRRPSGGGAIVHGSDLTYAAAVPKTHPWGASPQVLYDALHAARAEALREQGIEAVLWRPPGSPAPAAASTAGDDSFFCFDRRASGDLVVHEQAAAAGGRGHKIMGSAQRRLEGAVLQHGSLLVRRNGTLAGRACHPGVSDLCASRPTADLEPQPLLERWLQLVAQTLEADVLSQPGEFRGLHSRNLDDHAARFRDAGWIGRR